MQFTQSTMEEVFLRFPHLSEDIFNALDNKTFATCKEVSELWYNCLDEEKFVQERRVEIIKKVIKKFHPDFQQSLEVIQANISLTHYPGMSLAEYKWLNLVEKTSLQARFSSAFDTATVQKFLQEARNGNFDMVHAMIMVEFQKVYYPITHHSRQPVPSIIYNLANINKHKEVIDYLRLKCRFTELEKHLYLGKFGNDIITDKKSFGSEYFALKDTKKWWWQSTNAHSIPPALET